MFAGIYYYQSVCLPPPSLNLPPHPSPLTITQVSHLCPALHQLIHYGHQALRFGCLRWYWMFGFEIFNKVIPNCIHTPHTPTHNILTPKGNGLCVGLVLKYHFAHQKVLPLPNS